ncbi:MAG: PAS domain S-box protein [Ardenticatenaceae bacterium]|nr:PAS domain S-box protein [Ardenticatenaceae bacterium]
MRERLGLHLYSLTVQMILSYIGLVLLTAVALGIPAIWLIRNQIEEQAWARLDQGSRATAALFAGWRGKVDDLAALTSQRPTLQTLLAAEDQSALLDYLQILRADTELDLLLVCHEDQLIAQEGTAVPSNICQTYLTAGYYNLAQQNDKSAIWLLSGHNIIHESELLGQVIAGVALDQTFLQNMQAQTGLEHSLFPNGHSVVGDLSAGRIDSAKFVQNGRSYYAAPIPLTPAGAAPPFNLADRAALDVTDIVATERSLMGILIGGIGLITLVGSALGLVLARRIGRPLAQLADAADVISQGELAQPITVRSGIRQVSQVAQALEQARSELQQTIHELRQAKAWTDHLLDSIVEGIVTLDDNGRITFFSPGAERITGWKQSEAIGRSLDDICLIANSDEPFSRRLPAPGKRQKVTVQLTRRQATLAITGAHLTLPTAGHSGPALVLRDVTEGEVMHRLLGEFLANITHEFRTPLTALAVSAELLLEQAPELHPDELHELLTSLHLGILGLQTLIDNLLESARLEAGRFDIRPQPSDLGEMIAEATRIMQPLQGKYGHQLLVELPGTIPIVQADARRVVQVLVNLLSNAIKYSPDGSEIGLAITAVPDRDDTAVPHWIKISIADRGPGVPADFQAQAFQPFAHPQAVENSVRHGVGLGLSVVKAIVEAHGGQVGLDDRHGGGSIFWFTLPIMSDE